MCVWLKHSVTNTINGMAKELPTLPSLVDMAMYEGWNFNSGNY